MRIAILSRQPSLYSTRVLVESALKRGHEVRVLATLQFDIRVSEPNAEVFYQGEPGAPGGGGSPAADAGAAGPRG